MKNIAIICNPKAGSNNKAFLQKLIRKLSDSSKVTLFETSKAGDATTIAKKLSNKFDVVPILLKLFPELLIRLILKIR